MVSALDISDHPPVSVPAAGVNLAHLINPFITTIDQTAHDDLRVSTSTSASTSALAINDLTPVSVPAIGIRNVLPSPLLPY